uniref:Uncharacterized protein n=1 Tax=Palpitomonas bilix TaxID=652834 RepID=A0A7S3GL74_9EUKA|mmetsp:Transcript_8058/g.21284  ORF Transcript_8058/g.21284 Transcript_8058/m.21284 type:complete len:189 (+) Transcript_8058:147-713(+)
MQVEAHRDGIGGLKRYLESDVETDDQTRELAEVQAGMRTGIYDKDENKNREPFPLKGKVYKPILPLDWYDRAVQRALLALCVCLIQACLFRPPSATQPPLAHLYIFIFHLLFVHFTVDAGMAHVGSHMMHILFTSGSFIPVPPQHGTNAFVFVTFFALSLCYLYPTQIGRAAAQCTRRQRLSMWGRGE